MHNRLYFKRNQLLIAIARHTRSLIVSLFSSPLMRCRSYHCCGFSLSEQLRGKDFGHIRQVSSTVGSGNGFRIPNRTSAPSQRKFHSENISVGSKKPPAQLYVTEYSRIFLAETLSLGIWRDSNMDFTQPYTVRIIWKIVDLYFLVLLFTHEYKARTARSRHFRSA
jgi:hypothetical protein